MKRIRFILAASAIVCALALSATWWTIGFYANRQVERLLGASRASFVQMLENSLDATLWYAASLGSYYLDYSPRPRSVKEMQDLAELLYVDELTLVGTNGIAVASNYGEYVGFDWHSTPETAAYLKLFDPESKVQLLTQPFRPCVISSDHYRKFVGVVFTNRLGLVQVGYSMERLIDTMRWTEANVFTRWRFARYGRFGALDADGDGLPDEVESVRNGSVPMGRITRETINGEIWLRLVFPFAGHLFYAEVPEREYGDQRNVSFGVAAGVILLLLSLFTVLLIRLRLSSVRVENLRLEADRRTAADLRLAHTIQMSTLPHAQAFNAETSSCALEAEMVPAREVGGDFYDFFRLADGRAALVIGDVSGKGVPAAMFMLVVKNAVRQAVYGESDPARAMARVNAALCTDNEANMFVTLFLALLDPDSGEVTYVNAGHNRPFVVMAHGFVERLDVRGGRLLGLFPGLEFRAARLRLGSGDRLFLYTDGVTEAQNAEGRLYGEARLKGLLASQPMKLCEAVQRDVAEHVAGAPASDDLTMLALSWRGQ